MKTKVDIQVYTSYLAEDDYQDYLNDLELKLKELPETVKVEIGLGEEYED